NTALCRSNSLQLFDGAGNLQVFELELKLLDLAEHLLTLRAEQHPLQLLDQQHQAFDLAGSRVECRRIALMLRDQQSLHRFEIKRIEVRKRGGNHERSMS